jgi:hypothetical protein
MNSNSPARGKALLIGGALGALTGAGVAYLLLQRAEKDHGELKISTGEGVRLGLLVLGLLRQVLELGEPAEAKQIRKP